MAETKKSNITYKNQVTLTVQLREAPLLTEREVKIGSSNVKAKISKANSYWPPFSFGMLNFNEADIVAKAKKELKQGDIITFTGKVWNRYNSTTRQTFLSFEVFKFEKHITKSVRKKPTSTIEQSKKITSLQKVKTATSKNTKIAPKTKKTVATNLKRGKI